jgi:hypothetical protein
VVVLETKQQGNKRSSYFHSSTGVLSATGFQEAVGINVYSEANLLVLFPAAVLQNSTIFYWYNRNSFK